MAQSESGTIEILERFIGQDDPIAGTAVPRPLGYLRVVGQGIAENDSGAPRLAGAPGGVRLTTTNEDNHTAGIETNVFIDPATMGTVVVEARVQFENLDTKEAFIGLTDIAIASDVPSIETDLCHGATTTLTLTASDLCGFLLSSELTEDEMWHGVYKGGSTTGPTVSTNTQLGVDAVAGEWDIVRLEVDPNGTARWYVNGELKQTVEGAVSPTVDLKAFVAVEAKGADIETMDVNYVLIRANQDWTV
jgi:hypothetical protein